MYEGTQKTCPKKGTVVKFKNHLKIQNQHLKTHHNSPNLGKVQQHVKTVEDKVCHVCLYGWGGELITL